MRWLVALLSLASGCTTLPCNGAAALCGLPLDAVTFPGTHNAMSNADEGWAAPNQQHPPARQLEDGIRAMLLDTYLDEGEAVLCHGFCALGRTPLRDVLEELAAFLDANPREVVVLVMQDALPVDDTLVAFQDAGLSDRLIVAPQEGTSWPTLGALVADDRRVLLTRESGEPGPAAYRPFYELAWDTPYSFRTPEEFTCDLLRGDRDHALFQVNHWLADPLPSLRTAEVANSAATLRQRLADCEAEVGRRPTVLAVDFYAEGDLFEVVAELNEAAAR